MTHTVDRTTARLITAELETAVREVLARHGFVAGTVRGSYGDALKVTIEASPEVLGTNNVNTATPQALAYERYRQVYGLPNGALGVTFTVNGRQYVFTGVTPSRPKYPIDATGVADGKRYKFTVHTVRNITAALGSAL